MCLYSFNQSLRLLQISHYNNSASTINIIIKFEETFSTVSFKIKGLKSLRISDIHSLLPEGNDFPLVDFRSILKSDHVHKVTHVTQSQCIKLIFCLQHPEFRTEC